MKLKNIITILAALPVVAGLTACKSDAELDAKPAKEILMVLGGNVIEYRADQTTPSTDVNIQADCRWTVSYDQGDFAGDLTVQPSLGNGNGSLVIQSNENGTLSNREATITLTSDGGLKQKITVRQTSTDPGMSVTKETYDFTAEDGTPQQLTITCNDSWTLQMPPGVDWFQVTDASGAAVTSGSQGATSVYVSVAPAVSDADRTATFSIHYGTKSAQIEVTQKGLSNIYLRTVGTLGTFGTAGGEGEVAIECNAAWYAYVPSSDQWVTIEPAAQTGDGTLRVFCEPNSSTRGRTTAIVVVSGSKDPKQSVIVVEQDGTGAQPSNQLTLSSLTTLYVSDVAAEFHFSFVADEVAGNYGLVYSTANTAPTLSDNVLTLGNGGTQRNVLGVLENLQPTTTYYVRAYAVNSSTGDTVYSNTVTITTSSSAREPGESDNPDPQLSPKR